MNFIEWLKVIVLGIVEGITEWLPISSTGHLILTDAIWPLQQSDAFKEMFNVVIQLGAILAVVVLYWSKLWPAALVVRPAEHERLRGRPAALRRPLLLHGQDRHVAEDRGVLPACHAHRPASERLARQALL